MKRRDRFWIYGLLRIISILIIFLGVSFYNIVQFNASFIKDEIKELDIFKHQTQWAITKILQNDNFEELKNYSNNLRKYKEFNFRIFDKDKNLIVSTSDNRNSILANNDTRLKKTKFNLWDLYKYSFKDKVLESTNELEINRKKYYLEVSISQDFVISSIIDAQKNIIILFGICLILLIISIIHIFFSIRNSFNKLEDSVIKISQNELDTKIEVPKNGLLEELALSIVSMTQKLKMQIERLSKLEQYKTEFIQNITHEFKTPITAINSAVELILGNNNISPIDKECLDIINFQTNSINKLVNDILSLGEIDLKKTEEIKTFQTVNLREIIKEAVDYQGITDCKINIISKEDVIKKADRELLIIMISNLLSNAIKYSKSDVIDIIIDKNSIEIKDYGIGIEKKHLPQIFERFYRVDKSRSREKGGTGLGLSIVKNIVELHNWEIEVQSEINKGTSFKILTNK